MIDLVNISKTFSTKASQVHAVNDVSLHIKKGEIFGIIGFSGAGKSTLVRCINLLERPTLGKVIVDGVDLTSLNEKQLREERKKIGMIFQHFNLMRSRTVAENIAYPLKGSKLSKDEIKKKVNSLIELVDLKGKENSYPSQLSGGQKQRVAIARALANDPKLLLCDEATSALDPQTTKSILQLIKSLNERLGITVVLITHEMAVVKEICHSVAVMENGHLIEQGAILDVFSNPQHAVTRNFIDSTFSINKIYELIDNRNEIVDVKENERLVILKYSAGNTDKALISDVAHQFGVVPNIVFGNIEVIQNAPLGSLIVKLSGEKNAIDQAIEYLQVNHVKVEVLK